MAKMKEYLLDQYEKGQEVKVASREVTYRLVVEQVFFEDGSELILKTGWPEGQEADLDITAQWVGSEPQWAKGKTAEELDRVTNELR